MVWYGMHACMVWYGMVCMYSMVGKLAIMYGMCGTWMYGVGWYVCMNGMVWQACMYGMVCMYSMVGKLAIMYGMCGMHGMVWYGMHVQYGMICIHDVWGVLPQLEECLV